MFDSRFLVVAILALAELDDSITTYWGLHSGRGVEINPVSAFIVSVGGVALLIGLKLGVVAALAGILWKAKRLPSWALPVLAIVGAATGFAAMMNVVAIK